MWGEAEERGVTLAEEGEKLLRSAVDSEGFGGDGLLKMKLMRK